MIVLYQRASLHIHQTMPILGPKYYFYRGPTAYFANNNINLLSNHNKPPP